MFRVGNRQLAQAAVSGGAADVCQTLVHPHGRARRRKRYQPADPVEHARVHGQPLRSQARDERLVGRQEQLERRALLDLPGNVARGPVRHANAETGFTPVRGDHVAQGNPEVGGSGNGRGRLRRGGGRQQQDREAGEEGAEEHGD